MKKTTLFLLMILSATQAFAKNVDLSTLPDRDTVQLTIYNAEDITLVRETRRLTFKQGNNPLQFSWANTLIDPTSVQLRFPKDSHQLELMDTTFPHDKPQMLYWNVQSELSGEALVEISYFTSGLTWSADYSCITNPSETQMDITGYVRVFNNSGEEYENAQVRLVVGKINLVEKIAELARRHFGVEEADELAKPKRVKLRQMAAGAVMSSFDGDTIGYEPALVIKEVVKESIGEYFLYTIEGKETIPNGWSKRMLSFEGSDVPFDIEYRFRPAEYGNQLVRMFLLVNDTESKLGTTPLPNGVVYLYRDNGRDGLSYLSQQNLKYVPIGDDIEFNLGRDPEVIHEQIKVKSWRDDFWFRRAGMQLYRNLGGQHAIEIKDEVAGWADHVEYVDRIRNYRDKPVTVEFRRSFNGHVVFGSDLSPKLHTFNTVEFTANCPAGKRTDLKYHVQTKQGHLAKQNNVTLEQSE